MVLILGVLTICKASTIDADKLTRTGIFIHHTPITETHLICATAHPQGLSFLLSRLPEPPTPAFLRPAFFEAAKKGRVESLSILLSHGLHPNEVTEEHCIPALAFSFKTRSTETAEFLLSKGASARDPRVLRCAVIFGIPVEFLETTLIEEHHAEPTPLAVVHALASQRADVVRMLVDRGRTKFTLADVAKIMEIRSTLTF
ncbi:hypothetical protein BC832DRAFT_113771 [Gaertneriomyces semiglobifer]|nr:hypothetical protein BC832DRAFT_113771 [Gaertneriomyces semiglobifer]